MPADEFKLVLKIYSILETEAIKNRYKLELGCLTYWDRVFTRFGLF